MRHIHFGRFHRGGKGLRIAFAVAVALAATATAPARADCQQSGTTVTCTGVDANGFGTGTEDGLTVTVAPNATISVGNGAVAIWLRDGNVVTNGGLIAAGDGSVGIAVRDFGSVTNAGTITVGIGSVGIFARDNSAQITNNGTINVGTAGVGIFLSGVGNAVNNVGTINAGSDGYGIYLNDAANTVTNYGLIMASVNAFSIGSNAGGGGGNFVNNVGTLDGRIDLRGTLDALSNSGVITVTNPGTAVGVQHYVDGNFVQTAAGTLRFRVDQSGAYDRLFVNTTATLGGSLHAVVQPGLYGSTTTYFNIVQATDPLAGQFASVTVSSPFFNVAAVYNTNSVDLTLTRIPFGELPGSTANQRAVGNALEAGYSVTLSGTPATFYSNLLTTTVRDPLNQLSGEGTAATQGTAFGAAGMFMTLLMQQAMFQRGGDAVGLSGVTAAGVPLGYAPAPAPPPLPPPFAVAAPAPAPPQPPANRPWRVWAAGFGGNEVFGGDAQIGSANVDRRTWGGAAGLDFRPTPFVILGFSVGGSTSNFSVPERATSGTLAGGHVGGYAVGTWNSVYLAGTLSYSRFDNSTSRTITGIGPSEAAEGRFSSDHLGARLELGQRCVFDPFLVTPFIAAQFAQLWQRGYTETTMLTAGAAPGMLGLTYLPQATASVPTFLGVQVDARFKFAPGFVWSPYLRAAWVHEFMPVREITATFNTMPAVAFVVDGPRAGKDAIRVDTGSRLTLGSHAALFANFSGDYSERGHSYSGTGGLRVAW